MKINLFIATAALIVSFGTTSMAQSTITVGPSALFGVAIGTEAESAATALKKQLGPGDDSGWVDGCEFNGIQERFIQWGSLSAYFEVTPDRGKVLVNWSYGLDYESGDARPGGPLVSQIDLPNGVKMGKGSNFATAVRNYGGEPFVDDVFGVGIYNGTGFSLMTKDDNLNGPIDQVAVPHFMYCE
jgi:hypothetical protein